MWILGDPILRQPLDIAFGQRMILAHSLGPFSRTTRSRLNTNAARGNVLRCSTKPFAKHESPAAISVIAVNRSHAARRVVSRHCKDGLNCRTGPPQDGRHLEGWTKVSGLS